MDKRLYWLGFAVMNGIGPAKFKLLLQHFGTAKDAYNASEKSLINIDLGEKLTQKFIQFRESFSLNDYADALKKKGVSFLILTDPGYPELLRQINNPPFVLFVKGEIDTLTLQPFIAVVGTRKTTHYGREVTHLITSQLTDAGFVIVSGLAMGVDAVAHQTAIENGAKTIAVLGCGVDCCTPGINQDIYNSIVNGGGCVISELPLSHPPTKGSFPSRNRIIAGLSLGVVVTEGAEDSGALITADYAVKFGRPVFAVPGPITSGMSKGPLKLLKKGATLVTSGEDIVSKLQISNKYQFPISNKTQKTKFKTETKEERKILELLENESLHFDEIVKRSKLDSAKVGSLLSMMEIKGLVKTSQPGVFGIVVS